ATSRRPPPQSTFPRCTGVSRTAPVARLKVTIDGPRGSVKSRKRPRELAASSAGRRAGLTGHRDQRLARYRPAAYPGQRPDLDPRVAVVEGVVVVVYEPVGPAAGEDELPAGADHAGVGSLDLHPAAVRHGGARRVDVGPGDGRGPADLDVVRATDAPAAVVDRDEQVVVTVVVGDPGPLLGVGERLGGQRVDGRRGGGLA